MILWALNGHGHVLYGTVTCSQFSIFFSFPCFGGHGCEIDIRLEQMCKLSGAKDMKSWKVGAYFLTHACFYRKDVHQMKVGVNGGKQLDYPD